LFITLNGEPFEIDQPLSVSDLLSRLAVDPRRVAVEHNLAILKRQAFAEAIVREGDTIEIVNFVGGGEANQESSIKNQESRIKNSD
jgi:thiamine biosynthesis protein ThiS